MNLFKNRNKNLQPKQEPSYVNKEEDNYKNKQHQKQMEKQMKELRDNIEKRKQQKAQKKEKKEQKYKQKKKRKDSIDMSPPRIRKSRIIQSPQRREVGFWENIWTKMPFVCTSRNEQYDHKS